LTVPGTAPNMFFTAPDMPILPWLFSLHTSITASAFRR
jgi:hypothetical protein